MFFTFLTKIFKAHHLSLIRSVFLFTFFVSLLQLILFILHYIVYQTIITLHPFPDPLLFDFLTLFFFWVSMTFVFFSIIGSYTFNPVIRFFYTLSAWWLGTLYWLFLGSVLLCAVFLVWPAGLIFSPMATILMIALALSISMYGTLHTQSLRTNRQVISFPNLNPAWENKTIALIADTHFGHVWSLGRARYIAKRLTLLQPDLLLIPGDFYDGPPAPYKALAQIFGNLSIPRGIFFVAGNHEQFRPSTPYTEALCQAGIKVLTNEKAYVQGLQLIGVTYLDTQTAESTRSVLKTIGIIKNVPSILLKHVPKNAEVLEEFAINLQVSGHTHNGQVWPFGYLTNFVYKGFAKGLKSAGDSLVLTTTGAGTWGPMQRVGTNAEIVLITIKKSP